MVRHLLCDQPATDHCPPRFRVVASSWIDARNFGDTAIKTAPPAGIRLRWPPFIAAPGIDRIGKPYRYIVERAGPLPAEMMIEFRPRVGHASRSPTPKALWHALGKDSLASSPLVFRASGPECAGVEAIAFSVPPSGAPAMVTLIDVNGIAQVTAEVGPGDDFHFAFSDIKIVSFSNDAGVNEVTGLNLAQGNEVIRDFTPIVEISADAWTHQKLASLKERVSNSHGDPFLSIEDEAWKQLTNAGLAIEDFISRGLDVPKEYPAVISLVAGTSFEAAALIGCGFIDGEHPSHLKIDTLVGPMLPSPSCDVFAYRVRAQLARPNTEVAEVISELTLACASMAPRLSEPQCKLLPTPVSKAEITNAIRPGPTPNDPQKYADAAEHVTCTGQWKLSYSIPESDWIATHPVAEDSAINGAKFVDSGIFLNGTNGPPIRVVHNTVVETREHRFDLPYFDSEVGCEAQTWDFWDRRSIPTAAQMVRPRIEYSGQSAPLLSARCRAAEGGRGPEVDLTLTKVSPSWRSDELAANSNASILFLVRDQSSPLQDERDVEIGPPSPTLDGHWSAAIRSTFAQIEADRFVGGMLSVGHLTFRVRSVGAIQGDQARCTFEVLSECAGAIVYQCPNGWLPAHLSQDPMSPTLWSILKGSTDAPVVVRITPTGEPDRTTVTAALTNLKASTTLLFTTMLRFSFEGEIYESRMSFPIVAPYIHPAPPEPVACLDIQQLGSDYYRRVLIKAQASKCHPLNPDLFSKVLVAPNDFSESKAKDLRKIFLDSKVDGLYGAQRPREGFIIYDAFSGLDQLNEGARFTVGLSYVRMADNRESPPSLEDGSTDDSTRPVVRTSSVRRIE